MRNDAATVGCAVLIIAIANLAFWAALIAGAAYIVKLVIFS